MPPLQLQPPPPRWCRQQQQQPVAGTAQRPPAAQRARDAATSPATGDVHVRDERGVHGAHVHADCDDGVTQGDHDDVLMTLLLPPLPPPPRVNARRVQREGGVRDGEDVHQGDDDAALEDGRSEEIVLRRPRPRRRRPQMGLRVCSVWVPSTKSSGCWRTTATGWWHLDWRSTTGLTATS